jgi:membrane protein YdbS with pleckstrin-like domain
MRPEPKEKIDARAYRVWQLNGWTTGGIFALITLVLFTIGKLFDWPAFIWMIAAAITLLIIIFFVFVIPGIRMKRWRYEVFEEEVDIQHGVFVTKRTLIPMVKVQQVDTEQGPFLKRYGLATVALSTAAGRHEIPALSQEVADQLRDQIAKLARVTENDI